MLLGFIDTLLLGFFVSPSHVGTYFAATRIVQFVTLAQDSSTAATAQRFSEISTAGDHMTMLALVRRSARLTTLVSSAVGLMLLLGGPCLLEIFGPGFQESYDILVILIIGSILQSFFGPAEDLLKMLGYGRICATLTSASLILAIFLCLQLIPHLGTIGAATAMAVALTCRSAALAITAGRYLGFSTHVLA